MSYNPNKVSALGAVIILATTCIISASAQTQPAVATSRMAPDPIRASPATSGETKPIAPTGHSGLVTSSGETSEVTPRSEVSDPVRTDDETTVAAGEAETTGRATTASPQAAAADAWQFQFTPYLWIVSITGRAGIGPLVTDTSTSVTNSNVELNFGFMGTLEAHKNRFVILTDLQYSDLSTERGNPGPLFSSTRASFKTFVFDPEIGYRILDNGKGAFVDVLGGIRYWHVNGDLQFRAGVLPAVEVSRSRGWVDGVAGLRGKAALSPRWFLSGKADLGGGGSNFTYQLFGGVGLNLGKRFALVGGYRDLNVNYNKDGFLFDMSLHGPVVGLGIKF